VTFFFGLLLWAVPPAPKYLLLMPLACALTAAPPNMGTGVVEDYGMLVAAAITVGWIIWRDRASGPTLAHRDRRATVRLDDRLVRP
jgi:hypothetical protein